MGEAGGGLLLLLGLATPLAAAAIVGVMLNAIASVHGTKGPWVSDGGYEYNVVLMTAALVVALAGAGEWSLDAAIGWDPAGTAWGLAALSGGLFAAGAALWCREPDEATAGTESDLRDGDREHARVA